MGGKEPRLIITDEDASMREAMSVVLPNTKHRLCMWHIMKKLPEKIGPHLREEPDNEWLATRYKIRKSWIPAYFMDIFLAGVLRMTSRQEELIADNTSMHTTPQILTTWGIERKGSELFTHEVFNEFQKEVVAAREHCDVQGAELVDGVKIVAITDASKKVKEVCCNTSTMVEKCSCMLFESLGIPCCHIVRFLRAAKVEDSNELPNHYVLKRWEKNCKRDCVYDSEGNLLAEKPIDSIDATKRRKISDASNKFEALIQMAKNSDEGMDFLTTNLLNMEVKGKCFPLEAVVVYETIDP
ncbi:protein FAR1-RELATED SEQUENCE 5-like [Brachypodium distachyon]|uniref:protein FAR1-RELATED SEQUENCE 5-like n=1 Tax=Brachypodium distachyon TaxID=15368 RepID=UPI000D0DD522|nr:protein FAR1-RELATED SEQUENCE 5-like [Brachypodium distachyon]|eukprot:XP_024313916.1 protein FAR1-RELATED SEQUENCE 5-like [Brachypodium distachyon]